MLSSSSAITTTGGIAMFWCVVFDRRKRYGRSMPDDVAACVCVYTWARMGRSTKRQWARAAENYRRELWLLVGGHGD